MSCSGWYVRGQKNHVAKDLKSKNYSEESGFRGNGLNEASGPRAEKQTKNLRVNFASECKKGGLGSSVALQPFR